MVEYSTLKRMSKLVKLGVKLGKGTASVTPSNSAQLKRSEETLLESEGIGAFLLPLLFLLLPYIFGKFFTQHQSSLALVARVGLAVGAYVGLIAYGTFLSVFPASFDSLLGMLSTVVAGLLLFALYQKIAGTAKNTVEKKFSKKKQANIKIGLQIGCLIGTSLGAGVAFFFPPAALLAPALGALIMAPLAVRWMNTRSHSFSLSPKVLRYTLNIGALIGAALGIIVQMTVIHSGKASVYGFLGAGLGALTSIGVVLLMQPTSKKSLKETLLRLQFFSKAGSIVGAAFGAITLLLFFPAGNSALSVTMGILIGGLLGGISGIFSFQSPTTKAIEAKKSAPPIKKLNLALSMGGIIGSILGALIGAFALPSLTFTLGAVLGTCMGGMVGMIFCQSNLNPPSIKGIRLSASSAVKPATLVELPLLSISRESQRQPLSTPKRFP